MENESTSQTGADEEQTEAASLVATRPAVVKPKVIRRLPTICLRN